MSDQDGIDVVTFVVVVLLIAALVYFASYAGALIGSGL